MHRIINEILFLTAVAFQTATGLPPVKLTEPNRVIKTGFGFGGEFKRETRMDGRRK